MSAEFVELVAEKRSGRLVLGAYPDGDRFHVSDVATGEVFASAAGDPLVAVVQVAEALGLPWMRLEFNRYGEEVEPGCPVVEVEAEPGGGRRLRNNPLEVRAEREKQRRKRRGLGPREFPPRGREWVHPPPKPYTAAQEARFREVYGAYWRSPEFYADCARLYDSQPPGYWGRRLDERIAACWAEVLASGDRSW